MRKLIVGSALVVVVACGAARPGAGPTTHLEVGHPVDRLLHRGEVDRYTLQLAPGTVALVSVEQHGIDVAVTTYGPDGHRLARADHISEPAGIEHVAIEATTAGAYRVDIGPGEGPAFASGDTGRYVAQFDSVVSAEEYAARDAKRATDLAGFWEGLRPETEAFVAWARQAAIAIEDPAALTALVGSARIVAFGEADHFVHEYLVTRNTMFEELVEHAGITAYVGETGVAEAVAIDDFINGLGSASAPQVAGAAFTWIAMTMPENVELIEWMRAYNTHATRRLHFYGMDLSGGENGTFAHSRSAFDFVFSYLDTADPELARSARASFKPFLASFTTVGYHHLTASQRSSLATATTTFVTDFESRRLALVARSSIELFERARHVVHNAGQLEAYFRTTVIPVHAGDLPDPSERGVRDAAMAENLAWAAEHEGPAGRLFVYAHAQHIRRGPRIAWPGWPEDWMSAGQHAADRFGADYLAIGSVQSGGSDTPTFDALLTRVGRSRFLVDLRTDAPAIVTREWKLRADGLAEYGQPPFWTAVPRVCFDAIVFVGSSTPVVPTAR